MTEWRQEAGLLAVITLFALLVLGYLLAPGMAPYSPHSDIVAAHLTIKQALFDSVQAGHGIPYWRSDMLSGGPGLTHPQTLYTNPFQALFFLVPAVDAMGPTLWLHYLTMAVSYSILGRALGLGALPRLFMAIAGLLSFKLVAITYSGWLSVIPMVTAIPLLAAAVLHLIDRPRLGSALWLAAAGSLCLHSGHLQLLYYSILFLAPYFVFRALGVARGGDGAGSYFGVRMIAFGLLASVIAAAAAAYLLLPLAMEAPLTSRAGLNYKFFLAGNQATLQDLGTFLHPEALGTPLDQPNAEIWERVAYFGAIPELLAVVGAVLGRRRRHATFLMAGFVCSLLLAFDSPVNRLLYDYLPGYSLFRIPNRYFFLTSLFGLGLAGIGLSEIVQRVAKWSPSVAMRRAVPALLIALTAAEGAYYAHRYINTASTDFVLPSTNYQEFFSSDTSIFRVAPIQRSTINYGWASGLGIELITGFEPYNYVHYQVFFDLLRRQRVGFVAPVWTDLLEIPRPDLLDALNVKYLVTPAEIEPPEGYRRVAQWQNEPRYLFYREMTSGEVHVYANDNPFGRAFWAPAVLPASSLKEATRILRTRNARKMAVVEDPELNEIVRYSEPTGDIAVVKPYPGALRIKSLNSEVGFVVISEVWHPGWRATLDGVPTAIHRTDVALMGLEVPAGRHSLELEYRPLAWEASLGITLLGWSAFAVLVAWNLRHGKSQA